ncbi:hemolysin family protein [Candidatus Dependentiae bacterium]
MSIFYIELILFFISLFCAGLFAFLETAFTALRLFKIKELKVRVSKYKKLFASWENNPQRILITILIANNFAHVLCSVLIAQIMKGLLGNLGLIAGVPIATITILIFGEIIPKSLAKTHNERIFRASLFIINFLFHISYPIVTLLLAIANFFFRKLGKSHILEKQHEDVSEKEIEFLIDYSDEKGLMEAEKSEMLQNVFGLGQTLINEIMVPKTDVISLDVNSNLQQVMDLYSKYHLSRLPVYDEKEDNIIGIVHQKDVFDIVAKHEDKQIKELVRPVWFVPESKKINQLLSEFLKNKMHMAIVIDEYGSIVGLVTLEDVLEEIVGEIRDEHEVVRYQVVPLEKGGWLIDAGIALEEVEELLNIKFEVAESITLAGFLTESLQHLPKKGERVFYQGYCFQIQQASSRRVSQVLVFESTKE